MSNPNNAPFNPGGFESGGSSINIDPFNNESFFYPENQPETVLTSTQDQKGLNHQQSFNPMDASGNDGYTELFEKFVDAPKSDINMDEASPEALDGVNGPRQESLVSPAIAVIFPAVSRSVRTVC